MTITALGYLMTRTLCYTKSVSFVTLPVFILLNRPRFFSPFTAEQPHCVGIIDSTFGATAMEPHAPGKTCPRAEQAKNQNGVCERSYGRSSNMPWKAINNAQSPLINRRASKKGKNFCKDFLPQKFFLSPLTFFLCRKLTTVALSLHLQTFSSSVSSFNPLSLESSRPSAFVFPLPWPYRALLLPLPLSCLSSAHPLPPPIIFSPSPRPSLFSSRLPPFPFFCLFSSFFMVDWLSFRGRRFVLLPSVTRPVTARLDPRPL